MKVRNSEVCRRQYPALLQRAHSAGALLKISYNCCSPSVHGFNVDCLFTRVSSLPTHHHSFLLANTLFPSVYQPQSHMTAQNRLIRLPVLTDKHVQFYNYFQLSTTNSKHYGSKRCELSISLPALHNLMLTSLERTKKKNIQNTDDYQGVNPRYPKRDLNRQGNQRLTTNYIQK